jgi:hypothetical protein
VTFVLQRAALVILHGPCVSQTIDVVPLRRMVCPNLRVWAKNQPQDRDPAGQAPTPVGQAPTSASGLAGKHQHQRRDQTKTYCSSSEAGFRILELFWEGLWTNIQAPKNLTKLEGAWCGERCAGK